MKFKRRFYDSTINFKNISSKRLILAITIGLISALTIYSFFYVLAESFRVMSSGFERFPSVLNETDRNYYNLFFAGLSLIFGNSIFILLIFSRPERIISRSNPNRRRILNDQIFLNFNFGYWFAKIGLVFGVFSMCCMEFNFMPNFKFLSLILLVVLYLESWKNLSRIYIKKRLKYQVLHLIILIILTFGLSRLNIVDYRAIDKGLLARNPIVKLPFSNFYNDHRSRNYAELNIKVDLDENSQLKMFVYDHWILLNELPSIINSERAAIREELIPFLSVRISANKNLNIKEIKKVEAELYSINQQKIIYDVLTDDLSSSRFDKRGVIKRISPFSLKYKDVNNIPQPPIVIPQTSRIYTDTLVIDVGKEIKVNNANISKEMLLRKFKNHINGNTIFRYNYTEKANYQDYINILSTHYQAAYDLRKREQIIFLNPFESNNAYKKEQKELRKKYPILLLE